MSNANAIDLVWAKLPTFHQNYHEASNDSLVSFSGFIPPIVFNLAKSFWEGSVHYQNKKTAVYKIELIECLLRETYSINLEGSLITQSVQGFPGSLTINKILNVCHESTNKTIAKMGYKQRQLLIYTQIKRDLWALFLPSDIVKPSKDYKVGAWTSVKPSKADKEYDFNLEEGLLHYEELKKNEQGEMTLYHRLSKLKDPENLSKLITLVLELKKYGKNTDSFTDFDFKTQWSEGFDGNTFEPRGFPKI